MNRSATPFPAVTRRPCLLLVDDTPANIDVLVGLLRETYELKVANRGERALRICEEPGAVDLVLLDVMMPEMDGFEVCRRLRARPATRDLPVIFLTSKVKVEDMVEGFAAGASDYVAKPFQPDELRARVRTHLTLRAQQQEIAARNTELREMLQIVCHDVGNQFAVLSMALEIMQHHRDIPPTKFMPRIEAAVRNGIALTDLVRELRRSEDKGLALAPVPVRAALADALLLAEDRLAAKAITVASDVPEVTVHAEVCSLTNSVFGNLLTNAAKFSPRGGRIEITGEVRDGWLVLQFRDHGIGMPPAVQETLFDFSRSRSRQGTEGEKGNGFGMPLLHRLVTRYGGRVEVESRERESHPQDPGSTFTLHLPLAPT